MTGQLEADITQLNDINQLEVGIRPCRRPVASVKAQSATAATVSILTLPKND
jgi:hypothetical protein